MKPMQLFAAAALAVLSAPAFGTTTFMVTLSNAQEVPATVPTLAGGGARPASFGDATFVLDDAQSTLSYSINVYNIDFTGSQTADVNDNLVNAHIHAGPGITPTSNGPVVFGFIGNPFNDNNPNDRVITPFANGVGGNVSGIWDVGEGNNTTLTTQLPNLLNGRAYVNFHTVQFGGGEVRGNFGLTSVPEPGVWALMIGGFGLAGGAVRARRRLASIV